MPGAEKLGPDSLDGLVLVSNPAVTPDGRYILYTAARVSLATDSYESSILAVKVDSGEQIVLQSGPRDSCPVPSPDGRRYVFARKVEQRDRRGNKLPGIELRLASLDAPGASQLIARVEGIVSLSWSPDSRRLAAASPMGRPDEDVKEIETLPVWFNGKGFVYKTRIEPFIIDVDSGIMERIELGLNWLQVSDVAWSPDGKKIAISVAADMLRPYLLDVYVYDVENGEAHVVAQGLRGYGELAWSPDSKLLAYLGHRGERGFSSHQKIMLLNPETGGLECLTCSLDRNAVNTVNSDVRFRSCLKKLQWTIRGIYFLVSDSGRVILYRVQPGMEPEPVLDPGEAVVDEFSASRDGSIIAYTLMTPVDPKELYLYRGMEARRLTRHTEAWKRRYKLAQPRRFSFRASDGATVEGWVLPPPEGVEQRGWVLYIHGGPKTMWGYGFMHEFHVLSNAGYTVVYVNPRGSDGYSEDFADIRCRYGERDYMDLMEAVDYVVKQLGLPKSRAAVMGGSYGGFMTNWVIGHTSFFRAAVTMRGISNWISMYGTTDIGWYFVEDQLCCTPWRRSDLCWEKSPLRYADRIETPTLIIHSNEDYRCWLDQALQLYTALKLRGVETKLAIFPGENHDLSRSGKPRHRVKRLQLILDWLNKHIPGARNED
ncbi:putative peptidase [Pyrodictium delaneyi]|uniref:Acyl-peptide hydrolase n=1 Tax=Pyrodictium delaneyi TaxID=1273541 RepID=A0A0P0N1F2_9CREN|nr:S9 family peptidase [Pyrodictium delaneyi]ALL00232.1 putative peptidase [Pyrodictium delaneyi]